MKNSINLQTAWSTLENRMSVDESMMIFQSKDPGRRVYLKESKILKCVSTLLEQSSTRRRNNLQDELEILASIKLQYKKGVVMAHRLHRYEDGVCLELDYIDGVALNSIEITELKWWKFFMKLIPALWRLSFAGIAHNDVKPNNVLIDKQGEVWLIDFDQASMEKIHKALIYNFIVVRSSKSVRSGLFGLLRRALKDYRNLV
jgi:predicted Ser/Thr protein kinase